MSFSSLPSRRKALACARGVRAKQAMRQADEVSGKVRTEVGDDRFQHETAHSPPCPSPRPPSCLPLLTWWRRRGHRMSATVPLLPEVVAAGVGGADWVLGRPTVPRRTRAAKPGAQGAEVLSATTFALPHVGSGVGRTGARDLRPSRVERVAGGSEDLVAPRT